MSYADAPDAAAPAPDAAPAPAPQATVHFVFPFAWERRNVFGRETITMTTQMMDPHDPLWGFSFAGPMVFVAIDNVDTEPQLAFCASVASYSAEANQLFDDGDGFEGDPNELAMVWTLHCSHISSDPANLGRPATDEETDEWNANQNRLLPVAGANPLLRGYFIPNNPELLENDADDANMNDEFEQS